MKAPRFWSQPTPTLLARLLQPTGWAYGRATARRMQGLGERVGAPTICVGNFTVGGAGKTPTALALARMLIGDGRRVAFLSRGYGGPERVEPLLVEADSHTAAMVGDEPLLLTRVAQCWVGTDRIRSAQSAVEAGANVLILDDGLQIRGWPRTSPSRSWMAKAASATAFAFPLVRCARPFRPSCRSCRR